MAPLADAAAPFYCRRCPMAVYCSAACRNADAFHLPGGPECGRPWPVLLPVEAVAALRLARQLRVAGCDSAAARQVAALGTHFSELPAEDLVEMAALAALAHATWQLAVAEAGSPAGDASPQPPAVAGTAGEDVTVGEVLEALCRLQVSRLHLGGALFLRPPRLHVQDRRQRCARLCSCSHATTCSWLLASVSPAICRSTGWL